MHKTHYILSAILSDKAVSLFLFLEMFILIAATNIALGEYNSRTMLYEPVEQYLTKQGFLVYKHNDDLSSESVYNELSKLIGERDVDILEVKTCITPEVELTVIPDKVYDKLALPVSEGKLFNSKSNSSRCRIIVTQNNFGYRSGDIIKTDLSADIEIAAVLTDPTYIMHLNYNAKMSYEDMYRSYEKSFYEGQPEMYTCESELEKLGLDESDIIINPVSIVSFNEQLSDEEYAAIKEKLAANDMLLIDNKDILDRSRKILSDDFKRFIPAAFVFGMITLIGVLSCSIIGAKTILKKLTVFYCCGATKSDCVAVAAGKMSAIILASGIAAALMISFFKLLRAFNLIGFVFGIGNIVVTVGIIIGTILISMIAPIVLISRSDPCRLLAETADE